MVKLLVYILASACFWFFGLFIGSTLTKHYNYVIPKDKWMCAIEHIKSGDCVGYSINENEIKKYINSGHREHNLPERQPLLNTK